MKEIFIDTKIQTDSYIKIVQGDNNSEEYKLILIKDDHRINLTGRTIKLAFCDNDNKGDVLSDLVILNAENGEVLLPITSLISKCYGNYSCQIAIYDNNENFIEHSTYFSMTIEENLFIKIGEKLPKETYDKLNSVLDAVSKLDYNLKKLNTLSSKLDSDLIEGKNLINSLGSIKDLTVFKKQIDSLNKGLDSLKKLYMSGKLLNDEFFNIAVIHETKNNLDYVEFWLLINAKYDHVSGRFKRINVENFSFGWQMQGGGTYPGEENFGDFINQGMNLWKANGKKAYGKNDPNKNLTGEDIGALQSDGTWKEFGIMLGWTNVFMNDSYGGMTIGGAGFEIDGNGMFPFCRVSLGKFGGGSKDKNKKPEDYMIAYCGMIWNAYHGMFDSDSKGIDSYFWGMEAPIDYTPFGKPFNPYSNSAELENAKFVIKRRRANSSHYIEDWEYIFKIDISNNSAYINENLIPTTKVIEATIVNKTDFNMNYPDKSWNKDNTLIMAVKGILEDGTVKQFGNINATYTKYGIYGYLGGGFKSAKIILTKC